jgi:hypothetical protein
MSTCEDKEIRRSSYRRKSYTRQDGTHVKAANVKSGCIEDKGKKGKGKKLFEIKDKGFLTSEGYKLDKPVKTRHSSLKKASKKKGSLKVLQHLNAIRTLQKSNPDAYKKLDVDVKYMQKIHADEKK